MKICTKCGVEKPYVEFYKDKTKSDGLHSRCKLCNKKDVIEYNHNHKSEKSKYHKRRYEFRKLPYWIVYLLPDHNYVGKTRNPYFRMNEHKGTFGRNVSNWIELHRFNTEEEALAKEAEYHLAGYAGNKVLSRTSA